MSENDPRNSGPESIQTFYKVWLKEAFSPIKAYFVLLQKIMSKPDETAADIAHNRVDVKLLVRALIGGAIVAGAIDLVVSFLLGSTEETAPDIITTLIFMAAIFIGAVIVHPPLKWLGGKGSLQQTFFANAMVSAASPPVTSIAFAFSAWFGMTNSSVGYISTAMLLPILSSVHRVSRLKVGLTVFLIVPMVIFLFAVIIIFLFGVNIEDEKPIQYGSICRTHIGTCTVPTNPVGSTCYCFNSFTNNMDAGVIE
jgi:hypothetical protein